MRTALLCVLSLSLAASASASFELALISDRAANVVHRMDPETGAYLGSFGQNFLNGPGGVVLDQANNTVFVADTNRITKWNYNTGSYLGTLATGLAGTPISFSQNSSDGSFNFTTSNGVKRVSSAGAFIRTYTAAGTADYQFGLLASDGLYYVSRSTNGSGYRFEWQNASTGAFVGSAGWAADRYIALGGGSYLNLFTIGTTNYFEHDTLASGPTFTSQWTTNGQVSMTGGAFGHNGIFYSIGKSSANPAVGSIRKVDLAGRWAGTLYGTSFLVDPSGIAVVVAPEPSSLGLLGLGAFWLCRRKRKG